MSTKSITPPKNLSDLESMSEDDIRYLAQRGRIPSRLVRKYGERKIRDILDGESQIAPTPSPHVAPVAARTDEPDTNDLSSWTNKRLRTEIVTLSEELGEAPDLDGNKDALVARVEELRSRVEEESDAEDDDEDNEEE